MSARLTSLVVAFAVVSILAGSGTSATLAEPPVAFVWAEPAVGRASIAVERVAAHYRGANDTWLLNLDVQLQNKQTATLRVERITIRYPDSTIGTLIRSYLADDPDVALTSFQAKTLRIPETRLFPFPVPPTVSVSFQFRGYRDPITVTRSLVEWKSAVAGGAYRFPFDREDLPEGMYVSDDDTHVVGSGHRGSESQRFAYDYGVFRWTGSRWSAVKAGSKPGRRSKNEDFLIWDLPVRAMADGWVLRCGFSVTDQVPGVKGPGGGNSYRIVHANGEVALYAHLQRGTIPRSLCPKESVDFAPNQIRVKAGQVLGRVGNTGQSSGPHLHIHLGTTGKEGEQGRPILFGDIRVRLAGTGWQGSAPCSGGNKPFAPVTRAATGPWQLVDPLFRPGHGELARHGLEDTCFPDHFDAITQAGYGMSWLGGFDVGGKTYLNVVFTKTGPQVVRFGLTAAQYQTELEKAVADGFRPTHVESYVRGGQARYAFIAEKKSGPAYRAYHALGAEAHDSLVTELKKQSLVPVAASVVAPKGRPLYTGLWEKKSVGAWQLRSSIPLAEYQTWLESEAKAGRKLVHLDAWMSKGKPMLSAIVASKTGSVYVARHDLSGVEYQAEYEKWTGKGLRTQAVTTYRVGNAVRYAALWR